MRAASVCNQIRAKKNAGLPKLYKKLNLCQHALETSSIAHAAMLDVSPRQGKLVIKLD